MLRATLLMLCFAVVAQGHCLVMCHLALPCEVTDDIHKSAQHTSSVPTSPGNCHDETPEPSENEGCSNHASWRMVSASRFEKVAAKASKFAAPLERLPIETDIPSYGVLREASVSLTNPLLPYVRSTVLLI